MKAYTDQRQQYISQKILQSSLFKFFLGETKKNESYINAFSNTASNQYTLSLYEKVINEINSINDLNSGNIALNKIIRLLTNEAKERSPTLCEYADGVIEQLRQKLEPSDYNIINDSKSMDEFLFEKTKFLSKEIEEYADSLLDKKLSEISSHNYKKLSEVLSNNPVLVQYTQYLEQASDSYFTFMQKRLELDSLKEQPINYREEAGDYLFCNSNPWTDRPITEQ
jgi:hypothetical protein